MRVVRMILGGLIALFSLTPIWVAVGFFRLGAATWFGHPYHLEQHPFERFCVWALLGFGALLPGAFCVLRRRTSAWWLLVGFGAALLTADALPSNVLPTMLIPEAQESVTAKAWNLANAIAARSPLPANQTELTNDAVKAEGSDGLLGPYYRDGVVVPVHLVYVGGATGPFLADSVDASSPATIYCAVNSDRNQYWITVTMLDQNVGGRLRWLEASGNRNQPLVIDGTLRQ